MKGNCLLIVRHTVIGLLVYYTLILARTEKRCRYIALSA